MSIAVLCLLLLLAYLGGAVQRAQLVRNFGLASNSLWIALGVLCGPQAMLLITEEGLTELGPVVEVALGWLGLIIGLRAGTIADRRIGPSGFVLGYVGGLLVALVLATSAYWLGTRVLGLEPLASLLLGASLSAVASGGGQHLVRLMVGRCRATGPLTRTLAETTTVAEQVPLMLVGVAFTLIPRELPFDPGPLVWFAVTVLLGVGLGLTSTVLFGDQLHKTELWGVLLGTALLGIGISSRLGLAAMTTLFVAGLTMAATSPHRIVLRRVLRPTERVVLLPTLVLLGAHLDPNLTRLLVLFSALTVFARLFGWGVAFGGSSMALRSIRGGGFSSWISLFPIGHASICVAFSLSLALDSDLGDPLLSAAVMLAVVGELVSPLAVRRALTRAGEAGQLSASSDGPPDSMTGKDTLGLGASLPPPAVTPDRGVS